MLGYISSTRKKSCQCCVRAKRRCDLGYPICKRCFAKGLNCVYPNAAKAIVNEAEVVVRQTTPDLLPLAGCDLDRIEVPEVPSDAQLDEIFLQQPQPYETSSFSSDYESPETILHDNLCLSVLETILPQPWEPRILDDAQTNAIVSELCNFIPSMAYSGHTLFMHQNLYGCSKPEAYLDTCALSALYMVKTSRNIPILISSIDAKIAALISKSTSWTFAEHLAAVQAMIIYQIIRLFDPSLSQQPLAHKQNTLLELWTATLWKRSFNESPPAPPPSSNRCAESKRCYSTWIFQESLRRTVLMSVFVRGAWSCVTQNGLCDQIPILARLPLTLDVKLWDSSETEWSERGEKVGSTCPLESAVLTAYGDLSVSWEPGKRSVEELGAFERLLLVACRGGDDLRLLRTYQGCQGYDNAQAGFEGIGVPRMR